MTWPDYLVVGASLAGLLAVGFLSARPCRTGADFFLAGRELPVWAAVLSFLSAETSALTLLALPAAAYRENWRYAQYFLGAALARVVVAYLFVPAFYRYNCTTVYEYLRHRFGAGTERTGAALFIATRLLGSGVRLAAAGAAISALLGWRPAPVAFLLAATGAAYVFSGGLRSEAWTGVFQAAVFVGAGLATAFFLFGTIEGGLPEALRLAAGTGRLDVVNWRIGSDSVWTVAATGFLGSLAAFGSDQEFMQRMMAVRTRAQSQRAMLLTIPVGLLVSVLFLLTGTGLFAFYDQHPEMALPDSADRIYSHFAMQILPAGLRGLFLAGLVMASIDAPLASLSSSAVTDLYRPFLGKARSDAADVRAGRVLVCAFGAALAAAAGLLGSWGTLSWLAFRIGAVTYGPLLGMFLYGLVAERYLDSAPRGSEGANVAAMALTAALALALLWLSQSGRLPFSWNWLIPLGAAATIALARGLAPRADAAPPT